MIIKQVYILFFCMLLFLKVSAQDDYVNDNQMRYEDWTYKSYIQTVQLHESTFDANPAILKLVGINAPL